MDIAFPAVNLKGVLPQLVVTSFAVAGLLVDAFYRSTRMVFAISLLGLVLALLLFLSNWGKDGVYEGALLAVDNYTVFFNILFLLIAVATMLLSLHYIDLTGVDSGKYYPLILFATLGMMLLVSSMDLLLMFLSIELLSVSMYILVGSQRERWVSNEAAMKYLLMGAFASAFLLFGISLVFGATGSTSFIKIESALGGLAGGGPFLIHIGIAMMLVGLGFKIAMVPFHMWAPDVYDGAPTPITGFLSTGSKIAVFALILRLLMNPFSVPYSQWVVAFWVFAVLSMTLGNVAALLQRNVKRMLAYSSIAHAGYILIAVVAMDGRAMEAALLYMTVYAIMGLTAFGCIALLAKGEEERFSIEDYTGLAYNYPLQAVVLSVCLLSLAGIPLTAGFIGKFYLFSAAVKSGFIGLAVIGVLNSAISLYYYLGLMLRMYAMPTVAVEGMGHPLVGKLAVALLGILILVLGIYPSPLLGVIKEAVAALPAI
ncbi:MAG TPA: NADH-quinone oxidoreductase subunit N [Candidatus Hypogeohydataceae bacterium YC38]|nr:NADH-quinone oxidoreductase subunit N [Candidatus Brocadiales bacterium]